jgi:hypothetical protein
MLRLGSQETAFYAYKINHLQAHKKLQNRVKQRLFHGNAMRPKGAYFAQHERVSSRPTDFLRFNIVCDNMK